ncbi:hypothetical protein K469DRAFT_595852, partial [Zopfia rhizophila CBS 207.26]
IKYYILNKIIVKNYYLLLLTKKLLNNLKEILYISNINKLKAKLFYLYYKSSITSYISYNKIYKLLFYNTVYYYLVSIITLLYFSIILIKYFIVYLITFILFTLVIF